MSIKLSRTVTRRVIDEPAEYEHGRQVKSSVSHEETTPYDSTDRGAGGTIQTHVKVDGPISAEFTQEEATEVVKALVFAHKMGMNDSGRQRRIERALLRIGLDPADLAVFDD